MSITGPEVDVVVIGNLLIDELPNGVVEPGGAALYLSLAAARAGAVVGLHSVVGNDYPLEHLKAAGVKLSLELLDGPGGRTVISYSEEGRSLLHVGPGHLAMTPRRPHPFDAKIVILAPMPWESQIFHLQQCLPNTAFLDPYPTLNRERWLDLRSRCHGLRCLALNREELEMEIQEIPESVPLLVKEGADGGFYRPVQLRWKALSVEVLDPTGAGDTFLGTVAAGLALEKPWADCLSAGAEAAALVIQNIGARNLYPD